MKKSLLVLTAVLCLLSNLSIAQTKFTEGTITYKMAVESDNEQVKQMFNNSEMSIFIKDKKAASQMSMGIYMKMSMIGDAAGKKVVMLIDAMGQKKQINMTDKEYKEYKKKSKSDYKIEYVDETKTIAGYVCKKAIVTNDEGTKMQVWYTEDIALDKELVTYMMGNEYDKIKGFALEYQIAKNGTLMTFTVSNIQKGNVDDKTFEIPAGYDPMTIDELMQSQGAGK